MGRNPKHPLYSAMIEKAIGLGKSNYGVVRYIRMQLGAKDESEEQIAIAENTGINLTGQKIPSESTVRNYKKSIEFGNLSIKFDPETQQWKREISGPIFVQEHYNEIDKPWRSMIVDPDGISDYVTDFILTEILVDTFIMRHKALRYPKFFNDQYDSVTRRTARWMEKLFNRLSGEHPQLIWSIAWMYSGEERYSEEHKKMFDTRPFDYYVALKPWQSPRNRKRYDLAVRQGETKDLKPISMFYVLHLLQIPTEFSYKQAQSSKGLFDKSIFNAVMLEDNIETSKVNPDVWMDLWWRERYG